MDRLSFSVENETGQGEKIIRYFSHEDDYNEFSVFVDSHLCELSKNLGYSDSASLIVNAICDLFENYCNVYEDLKQLLLRGEGVFNAYVVEVVRQYFKKRYSIKLPKFFPDSLGVDVVGNQNQWLRCLQISEFHKNSVCYFPHTIPDELPSSGGIYAVLAKIENEIEFIYVGKSKNVKQRWGNHHRMPEIEMLHRVGVKIYYRVMYSKSGLIQFTDEQLSQIERTLIAATNPKLNNTPVYKKDNVKKLEDTYNLPDCVEDNDEPKEFTINVTESIESKLDKILNQRMDLRLKWLHYLYDFIYNWSRSEELRTYCDDSPENDKERYTCNDNADNAVVELKKLSKEMRFEDYGIDDKVVYKYIVNLAVNKLCNITCTDEDYSEED